MNDSSENTGNVTDSLPPPDSAIAWARRAMRNNRWQDATDRWTIVREVYPEEEASWVQSATAHRKLKEHEVAAQLLEEARQRFPTSLAPLLGLASLACDREHWGDAETLAEQARILEPDNPQAWLKSAEVASRRGDRQQAEAFNGQAREAFPNKPKVWIQHAELAMRAEDWNQALERWAIVRKRFPEHAEGFVRAAEAAKELGNEPLARQLLLAREYGNAWLESLQEDESEDDNEEEGEHRITPHQRRNLRTFADLVWTKARLNLKSEASQNHLRYVWWVLDPVLYMTVFYIVFGLLMERGGPGFIAYLLTGLVPFQWFAKTVQQTSNSIIGGKGLMHKVRISPLFFPLVGIVQNTGKQLLVFVMLGLFLILYGLPPTIHWLAFVPVVLTQLLLMVVVSCLVAMSIPFIRDLSNLVPTGIQFLLFTSGIFYTVDRIPEDWHTLFFSNPMANILFQYRQIFVENQWPVWSMLGWVALGSLIGLGVVLWLYRKLEPVFPRVVLE